MSTSTRKRTIVSAMLATAALALVAVGVPLSASATEGDYVPPQVTTSGGPGIIASDAQIICPGNALEGFGVDIEFSVLLGSEPHVPYERPPLSKAYLLGHDPIEKAFVHPGDWYAAHDVDLRTDTTVTGLHLDGRLVRTDAGDQPYDALLLATGGVFAGWFGPIQILLPA